MVENLKFRCCFCDKGIVKTNVDQLDISFLSLEKKVMEGVRVLTSIVIFLVQKRNWLLIFMGT